MLSAIREYFEGDIQAKTRVYKIHCVNMSFGLRFQLALASIFSSDVIDSRVHKSSKPFPKRLFSHTNAAQIEEKWGGISKNMI